MRKMLARIDIAGLTLGRTSHMVGCDEAPRTGAPSEKNKVETTIVQVWGELSRSGAERHAPVFV